MSVKVTNWVWHDPATQHLRGNSAMALLALADISDDDGHVVYARGKKRTQDELAKKARMSVATFRRVTGELAEAGLLEISRESQRTENEYRIVMTAQSERSELSGHVDVSERSERSTVSGHPSYRRSDVLDVVETASLSAVEEAFGRVWAAWPSHRRGTRKKSGSSFRTAVKAVGGVGNVGVIVSAAEAFTAVWRSWPQAEQQYVPGLATWLNQERWTEVPPQPRVGRMSTVDRGRSADEILAAREAERLAVSA